MIRHSKLKSTSKQTRGRRVEENGLYDANKDVWEKQELVARDGLCRNVSYSGLKKANRNCSVMNNQLIHIKFPFRTTSVMFQLYLLTRFNDLKFKASRLPCLLVQVKPQ